MSDLLYIMGLYSGTFTVVPHPKGVPLSASSNPPTLKSGSVIQTQTLGNPPSLHTTKPVSIQVTEADLSTISLKF